MKQGTVWASNLLRSDAVILDTETTGVSTEAQVIQLTAIDMRGATLFDSLFSPTCYIDHRATATHGMTLRHLQGKPKFSDAIDEIKRVLAGKTIVAYNVSFDLRMLRQTLVAFNCSTGWLLSCDFQCAMQSHMDYLGTTKKPKLEGGDHTALGDCLATLELIRKMAGVDQPKERVLSPAQQAYKTLRTTLQASERTAEIDDALKALEVLAMTIKELQAKSGEGK